MLPVSPSASHAQASARPVLRRRLGALTAAAVLIVSAVACSGGGTSAGTGASPTVDPYDVAASMRADDDATAAPSGSLSSEDAALRETALAMEAPEKPTAMSENSPEGAVAAAEYFISLYPYVYATGDLAEWDAMSEDRCVFCTSVHDNVTELHDGGGWAEPEEITVSGSNYRDPADGYEYSSVDVALETGTTRAHLAYNSSPVAAPSTYKTTMGVALRYVNGRWLIGECESS